MTDFKMVDLDSDGLEWSDLPLDETIVEVLLSDGTVARSFFAKDLTSPGDWDFSTIVDGFPGDASLTDQVVGWRDI